MRHIAGWASRGLQKLFPDPLTIELVGDGRLVPAYPAALTAPPGIIRQAVLARRSLLYGWTEDCYDASDFEFRLLRRQVCVFNAPASVKSVLVTENSLFERKGAMMRRSLEPLLGDGLFISDGDTWQRRRPLVADLVHKARLPLFGPAMTNGVTELVDHWLTLCAGEEVDLLPTMATLTAGIIARAVFGVSLAGEALREIVEGFAAYQAQVDSLNLLYFLGNPEGRSLHGNRKLAETVGRIRSVIEDVIAAHRRGEGDEDSMIAAMLRRGHFEGEAGLRNEAVTLFMAGHETTATTLTWALYILGKAPWAVEALRQEVDSISGGQPVEVGDVPNLLLTRAIIDETMRLYPPVPILPRQALRDARIGSLDVEQDALVLVCPWLLHRSPDLWDDPMAFRPERFLGEARPQPYSYLPFSAGPRLCPGMSFGINEAVICLATIMGRMHLELRPGFVATPVCRLSLRPRHPILAQVRPR